MPDRSFCFLENAEFFSCEPILGIVRLVNFLTHPPEADIRATLQWHLHCYKGPTEAVIV